MLISIAILAHNEEDVIAKTIASLWEQSIFRIAPEDLSPGLESVSVEIVVMPNGCNDQTAMVARTALQAGIADIQPGRATWIVHELERPGKSAAWNRYVHDVSSRDAELCIMIDADIEFGETKTIENAVRALLADSHAWVAVDTPLKDAAKKKRKSLIERVSLRASKEAIPASGRVPIAGSFYCARAQILRSIWMPDGLAGEDGFLRAMIVTNFFRSDVDELRVIRVEGATHYFETLRSMSAIFRHELRLVIGTTLNSYFTWDFLLFATDPTGAGAGILIKSRLEKDPNWYRSFIQNEVRNRGFWVIPRGLVFRRLSELRSGGRPISIKRVIFAMIGAVLDLSVCLVANRRLKQGRGVGFW